jgi:hypothetical protein
MENSNILFMKSIAHIEVPKEWESNNDWDSHRELLYVTLENTEGTVLEFGCGEGSTPLFFKYCREFGREFISYETNPLYASRMKRIDGVEGFLIKDYLQVVSDSGDVVFVDCAPGELRKDLIKKHNSAKVIIVHDTEPGANYVYGMAEILNSFKYRLNYTPKEKPHTTVVSNFINVEEWL